MSLDFSCFLTKFKKEWFFNEDNKLIEFDPNIILDHLFNEIEEARTKASGLYDIFLLDNLESQANVCKKHLDSNNTNKSAITFFLLGRLAHELESEVNDHTMAEYKKSFAITQKTTANFTEKTDIQRGVREFTQKLAKSYWLANPGHRTGEAAENIFDQVCSFLLAGKNKETDPDKKAVWLKRYDALPQEAKGIRTWITEVAPDSAKMPGRKPKK